MKRHHTILLLAALLVAACAKEGFPSGGPKDEKPPVVLNAMPENGTLNFDAKEFLINFDEYVNVRDAENNILVSPPMKQKPEYTTKGRGILVKIKDTLLANTTYLFQFKEGIADYNEGNVLKSYEYVFSTGSVIDSMSIRGQVLDALTLKAGTDPVTVVAFSAQQMADFDSVQRASDTLDSLVSARSYADSIVTKGQPMYVTHCDKEGLFELNHMREGQYLLLAFVDGDKNMHLNTGEAVAFLDTLVTAQHMPAVVDTTAVAADSATQADSAHLAPAVLDSARVSDSLESRQKEAAVEYPPIEPVTLRMSLFKEEKQRIVKAEFKRKGQIEIVTMCPLESVDSIALSSAKEGLYIASNVKRDTLIVWTQDRNCDSIRLTIHDRDFVDTLRLQFRSKTPVGKPMAGAKPSSMRSKVAASHPYYDTLRVVFENPIDSLIAIDTLPMPVKVFSLADSTTSYCPLVLDYNCQGLKGASCGWIDFRGKAGEKYKVTIPAGCLRDVYGRANLDELNIATEYTKAESYGNIIVQMQLPDTAKQYLVQLTNEKGDALRTEVLTRTEKVSFLHLKAGKYNLRVVADRNGDGQWTAGDYYLHRQPEPVVYFDKTLELRENWDMEEKWEVVIP